MVRISYRSVLFSVLDHLCEFSERQGVVLIIIVFPEESLDLLRCRVDTELFDDILKLIEINRVALVSVHKLKYFENSAALKHRHL